MYFHLCWAAFGLRSLEHGFAGGRLSSLLCSRHGALASQSLSRCHPVVLLQCPYCNLSVQIPNRAFPTGSCQMRTAGACRGLCESGLKSRSSAPVLIPKVACKCVPLALRSLPFCLQAGDLRAPMIGPCRGEAQPERTVPPPAYPGTRSSSSLARPFSPSPPAKPPWPPAASTRTPSCSLSRSSCTPYHSGLAPKLLLLLMVVAESPRAITVLELVPLQAFAMGRNLAPYLGKGHASRVPRDHLVPAKLKCDSQNCGDSALLQMRDGDR